MSASRSSILNVCRYRRGTQAGKARAQQFHQRVLAGPGFLGEFGGGLDGGLALRVGIYRLSLREAFGGEPKVFPFSLREKVARSAG